MHKQVTFSPPDVIAVIRLIPRDHEQIGVFDAMRFCILRVVEQLTPVDAVSPRDMKEYMRWFHAFHYHDWTEWHLKFSGPFILGYMISELSRDEIEPLLTDVFLEIYGLLSRIRLRPLTYEDLKMEYDDMVAEAYGNDESKFDEETPEERAARAMQEYSERAQHSPEEDAGFYTARDIRQSLSSSVHLGDSWKDPDGPKNPDGGDVMLT